MMRILALALACLTASPALSLSCSPSDPAQAFIFANESPDIWIVATGVLSFDESKLPNTSVVNAEPEGVSIAAVLDGHSLGSNGFKNRFSEKVTLDVGCIASWCGSAQSGATYLAFLKQDRDGYIAFADACPGNLFVNPTRQQLRTVRQCFNGGRCEPAQF